MKYPFEESSTLELKREIPKKDQIVKTIIGFCNQNGGKLVIGVGNDGTIIGIPDNKILILRESIEKTIYESALPPIIPLVYEQRIADKILLIIEVVSGMNKPYYLKSKGLESGAYVRLGKSTIRANLDLIEELKWQSRGQSFDLMPVYHTKEEDLDREKIAMFLESKKHGDKKTISKQVLRSYHLIVEEHTKSYPSVSGMLLFGIDPQYFLSEAMIICSHFKGIEGRDAIASKDCNGTLFQQFHDAFEFIIGCLNKSFVIKDVKREEKLEIPPEAIREILLNAIIHRNYHLKAPIKVAIFRNRIEIFSPGNFPGPINVNNLTTGLTYVRNRAICKVFREAGYVEKLGSGFITLFKSYEEYGLTKPTIIEGENFIKCILPRTAKKDVHFVESYELNNILKLFEIAHEITISDVVKLLNISRATAGRRLSELVKKELLMKIGQGKNVRYIKKLWGQS